MKIQCFKLFLGLLVSLVFFCQFFYVDSIFEFDEVIIIDCLEQIEDFIFELKYNSIVGVYIWGYFYCWEVWKAEFVIGRVVFYFLMIEVFLVKYSMLQQFKYFFVVEFVFDLYVIFLVGVEGFW